MRSSLSRWAVVAFVGAAVAACGDDTVAPPDDGPVEEQPQAWVDCQASDAAFVRRAVESLLGRRMWSQGEAQAWTETYRALLAANDGDPALARAQLVDVLARDRAFTERWAHFLMDALRVPRSLVVRDNGYDRREVPTCYGELPTPFDEGELAMYVRDNAPSASSPPRSRFTMGQLLVSTIQLDDISVVYRAHLFQLLKFPLSGANVGELDLERNRRAHAATQFNDIFIHRDVQCLACHNSDFSVTASVDPVANRAWPLRGSFERALFGSSAATDRDPLDYYSWLRFMDVADAGGAPPWGWDDLRCGTFGVPTNVDPLDVDTFFGSVRSTDNDPLRGKKASVWLVETAFRKGVEGLAENGLDIAADNTVDPDEAFAYLTAQNIVEQVWEELIGTSLTITNYFPRTEIQRDTLQTLTDSFVASRFSLRTLLSEIVAHPAYNLRSPANWCREDPYEIPRLFDVWTLDEADPAVRGNSSADRIQNRTGRALQLGLHAAMEWPPPADFPDEEELQFQRGIGAFVTAEEPGFRGLDLQSRLAWEDRYGRCPRIGDRDFITDLAASAGTSAATLEEAVVALKDRLLGDPTLDAAERATLEQLLGAPLASPVGESLDEQLRMTCGVFASSPRFLLDGLEPVEPTDAPRLTPANRSREAACAEVGALLQSAGLDPALACAE